MYHENSTRCAKKAAGPDTRWERLQLLRLIWALGLFLAVFLGRQLWPEKMVSVGQEVMAVLGQNTDLQAVFGQLGDSLVRDEGLQGLEEFCLRVFAPRNTMPKQTAAALPPQVPPHTAGTLSREIQPEIFFSDYSAKEGERRLEADVPAVGAVLVVGNAPEQPIPDGYTVDQLSFGDLETVAPVLGQVNSGFGYREHPVNGKYLFHGGTDIHANAGDPIAAFADGTVEYVGEDRSYGLYLQLDHGNGIKSFYAHCQSVCVRKGQSVRLGETVARVGSTGTATGPHLHLELKCGDVRVDPEYYIDVLCAV